MIDGIVILHLFIYGIMAAGLFVYLLLNYKTAAPCLWAGLLASPIGIIVPYLVFGAIVAGCHGSWPFEGIPVIDPVARLLVPTILLVGPIVGPPIVVYGIFKRSRRASTPDG